MCFTTQIDWGPPQEELRPHHHFYKARTYCAIKTNAKQARFRHESYSYSVSSYWQHKIVTTLTRERRFRRQQKKGPAADWPTGSAPQTPVWELKREPFARRAFGKNQSFLLIMRFMIFDHFGVDFGPQIKKNACQQSLKIMKTIKRCNNCCTFGGRLFQIWLNIHDFLNKNRPTLNQKISQFVD